MLRTMIHFLNIFNKVQKIYEMCTIDLLLWKSLDLLKSLRASVVFRVRSGFHVNFWHCLHLLCRLLAHILNSYCCYSRGYNTVISLSNFIYLWEYYTLVYFYHHVKVYFYIFKLYLELVLLFELLSCLFAFLSVKCAEQYLIKYISY